MRVVGVALLVLAAVLLLAGLAFAFVRGRGASTINPLRMLTTLTPPPPGSSDGLLEVTGTLAGPAALRGPITGRPCSVWEVALYQQERDGATQRPVWVTGAAGDLRISHDLRRTVVVTPGAGEPPGPAARPVPGRGTATIPASRVRVVAGPTRPTLAEIGDGAGRIAPDLAAPDLAALDRIGLPGELAERVRTAPADYRVAEGLITQGGFIRLGRRVDAAGAGPDELHLIPVSQEAIIAGASRWLAVSLVVLAVLGALAGAALLRSP